VIGDMQAGARVDRTGLALVHEGEYIVPAPGSEAAIETVQGMDASTPTTVRFPLEVVVIGSLGHDQKRELADYVLNELDVALRAQGG
jgi:hypothetical protein